MSGSAQSEAYAFIRRIDRPHHQPRQAALLKASTALNANTEISATTQPPRGPFKWRIVQAPMRATPVVLDRNAPTTEPRRNLSFRAARRRKTVDTIGKA